eukprot:1450893-Amphidinium_carterae.1
MSLLQKAAIDHPRSSIRPLQREHYTTGISRGSVFVAVVCYKPFEAGTTHDYALLSKQLSKLQKCLPKCSVACRAAVEFLRACGAQFRFLWCMLPGGEDSWEQNHCMRP